MKEVNLEAILKSKLTVETMRVNNPDYTWTKTMEAMKEACKQAIELCAENAEVDEIEVILYAKVTETKHIVDKQSILNTINKIV